MESFTPKSRPSCRKSRQTRDNTRRWVPRQFPNYAQFSGEFARLYPRRLFIIENCPECRHKCRGPVIMHAKRRFFEPRGTFAAANVKQINRYTAKDIRARMRRGFFARRSRRAAARWGPADFRAGLRYCLPGIVNVGATLLRRCSKRPVPGIMHFRHPQTFT